MNPTPLNLPDQPNHTSPPPHTPPSNNSNPPPSPQEISSHPKPPRASKSRRRRKPTKKEPQDTSTNPTAPPDHSLQGSHPLPSPDQPSNNRGGRKRNNKKRRNKFPAAAPTKTGSSLPSTSTSTVTQRQGNPTEDTESASEHSQRLEKLLSTGKYECMVCMDRINKTASIFSCHKCFTLYHIGCIQKWCKSSHTPTESRSSKKNNNRAEWQCPACRFPMKYAPKPKCFCGKSSKPAYNAFLVPHSCGETCNRSRKGGCPHKCTQICHPGPCAPCASLGKEKACFCGKTVFRLRCGDPGKAGKSCEQECGLPLSCGNHKCPHPCHSGPCAPCPITHTLPCFCGATNSSSLPCGQTGFSCPSKCNKLLSCGNHKCPNPCHEGPCAPCPTGLHITMCPCGSTELQWLGTPRESCLSPIPLCRTVCNKPLSPCGFHRCTSQCHPGECPSPCAESREVVCRCGSNTLTQSCQQRYPADREQGEPPVPPLCTIICKEKRLCGRHKCNSVCCPMLLIGPEAHPCPLTCNKPLPCGKHTCKQPCHKGKCSPCLEASFDEYHCRCGSTVVFPPISCGTVLPSCEQVCSREHSCNHVPTHPCHEEEDCPRCYALTTKPCGCGRVSNLTTKCYVEFPCCGDLCKKPLPCGLHMCSRSCHGGECTQQPLAPGTSCGSLCGAPRSSCEHTCAAPCHPGEECPSTLPCRTLVTIRCPCGMRTEKGECNKRSSDLPSTGSDPLSINNDLPSPGSDLPSPADIDKEEYIRLQCNSECALKFRECQLAIAFGRGPTASSKTQGNPQDSQKRLLLPIYSLTLTNMAVTIPVFLKRIEEIFHHFIHSKQPVYHFPPMNSFYRSFVHQLAEFYKLESVSHEYEPHRNISIHRTMRSSVPRVLLSSIISNHPIPMMPGTVRGESLSNQVNLQGTPAGLLFTNLNESVKSEHLHGILAAHRGSYHLKWIDDESAVALFNDLTAMKAAAYSTSTIPLFHSIPLLSTDLVNIFDSHKLPETSPLEVLALDDTTSLEGIPEEKEPGEIEEEELISQDNGTNKP